MASSGALSTSNQYVKYRIDVSPGTGNVSGNYTPVTVNVVAYRTNTGYTTYGSGTVWCKINGTTYSAGITSSQKITSSGVTLFSATVNVPHNADGTKTLSVSAWLSISNIGLSSSEQGFSVTLTTIPRSSSVSAVSGDTIGSEISVTISRASTSFTHELWYLIAKSDWIYIGKGYSTSCKFTPDMSGCRYITNAEDATMAIKVRTFSGTTQIGEDEIRWNNPIKVPESVVPTITSVAVTETVDGVATKFGTFVQNISKLKVVTSAEGKYESTIASYSVEVLGTSYSGQTITTNALTGSGSVKVNVTVKDSRGRTTTKTQTVSVEAYERPRIKTFEVLRAKSNGTEDMEGEYAACKVAFNISPVLNKNPKSHKIEYQKKGQTTWYTMKSGSVYSLDETILSTSAILNADSAYLLRLTVADHFTSDTAFFHVATGAPVLDFRDDGKAMAIGKVSEIEGFEVGWDALFKKSVKTEGFFLDYFGESVRNGLADYQSAGIDANTTLSELALCTKNIPHSGFSYIRTMFYQTKSASANRAQIAYPYSGGSSVYYRIYYSGKWSGWRKHASVDYSNGVLSMGSGLSVSMGAGTSMTYSDITDAVFCIVKVKADNYVTGVVMADDNYQLIKSTLDQGLFLRINSYTGKVETSTYYYDGKSVIQKIIPVFKEG